MNLGHPVFKVLGFANERERVKCAEEQNKLLLADYDPQKFAFRARNRSKEIQPDMRFRAMHQDNIPRTKTPQRRPKIKVGDILVRDKNRKIVSINGTAVKREPESVGGVLNNTLEAGDLRSSRQGRTVKFEADPISRSYDYRSSSPFATTTPLKKELASSSKERPNFKSIQQVYLNPRSFYYQRVVNDCGDKFLTVPHERISPKDRIELKELVKKYYKRKNENMNYDEISGGAIDDSILDGEKQIARRLRVNLFDIRDEMQEAKRRTESAKEVLDRCKVNAHRHRNVKSLTKGAGILAGTTYIN